MLSRALTLDERVRASGLFPRIRDAEAEMVKNEMEFQRKREQERKKREKMRKLDLKALATKGDASTSPVKPENHYFTGFVLNKDPSCSKYLPYDEIFFPKLFNKATQRSPPETLQSLWMLGFEDHIYRSNQPKPEHANAFKEMDTGVAATPSKQDAKKKKKKKNKHQFVAVYSNKPI